MTLDPRIAELLERYPLDLSDAELAEVHAAADADPELDALLSGMAEAEDLLDRERVSLSADGRARLDALVDAAYEAKGWSADLATPAAEADDGAKGWSADLATPAAHEGGPERDEAPASSNVVDLASRRRRRGPLLVAIAAAFVVGAVLALQTGPPDPEYGLKGDLEELEGVLWVMGDARLESGAARDATAPVTFRAVLEEGSVALVLLETQGDATHVIWPAVGGEWLAVAGPNPVGGASPAPYRPARPGRAEYHLVVASSAPDIHRGAVSLDEVVDAWGGRVLDRVAIDWR